MVSRSRDTYSLCGAALSPSLPHELKEVKMETDKYDAALDAIQLLFADQTRSFEEAADALRELKYEIDILIESLG